MEVFFLILLIAVLIGALASGYPVAFALPGSALITIGLAAASGYLFAGDTAAFFDQGDPLQWLNAAVTNFRGIYFEVERDTLIAIPLFVFMGIMLQRSKVAEDLLVAMAQLFGPIPGGLGISVIFVGALLAATTGIVGATVIAMGLISLPVMLRHKYSIPLATGTISASGTLGQIIPPSIVLIILADQLSSATDRASSLRKADYKEITGDFSMPSAFDLSSTSAGEMFLGAMVPGLVLVGIYMLYLLVMAIVKPKSAPPVPYEGKYDREFMRRVALSLIPPLTLIFAVLGSIVMGIATVNQAGAIGAIGAMIMAGYRLKAGESNAFYPAILAAVSILVIGVLLSFNDINVRNISGTMDVAVITAAFMAVIALIVAIVWSGFRAFKIEDTLTGVMVETAKTTSLVFIILLGAAMLTAAFRAFGGEEMVRHFLNDLPGGFTTKFIVVMAVIFVLGFFLDFIEIAVVVVPIIAPILLADTSANITGVWLGVMIGVNMQTSFLTPPFGFALFYLRGIAPPEVKTWQIYKGVVPFIALQLGALAIVGFYPSLVNYLPNRVSLTSETAPPPRNPRLQLCVEEYLFPEYDALRSSLRTSIATASALDFSALPDDLQKSMTDSFVKAKATFDKVEAVRQAGRELAAYTPSYRPLHVEVRGIQADVRKIEKKILKLSQQSRRMRSNGYDTSSVEADIQEARAEISALNAAIPANWTSQRAEYERLSKAESNARRAYRRTVDEAYEPLQNVQALISNTANLQAYEGRINALSDQVRSLDGEGAQNAIRLIESEIGAVNGTTKIKSALTKARRTLKKNASDKTTALTFVADASALLIAEMAWRTKAFRVLSAPLTTYNDAIKGNIGLRLQERLTSDQADVIASCKSHHRDISLDF
ncbi:TRAP transporter large permease subunit [Magnetovibrio sp. PR-2]|uniref:TRAP transporter large permease subunit n=1 Tax=Magnetovibrio sp. PR-2 TaxID=3120356 RepID=UPI002FCE2CA6